MTRTTKITITVDGQRGHHVTYLHECRGAPQVSVRLAPVQPSFDSSTRRIGVASQVLRFHVRPQLSQSRCICLLLAKTGRVYLLFPPRGHKPPPTFVTVLSDISASNTFVSQSPAIPNARMSLCTQSVPCFSFPPRVLRTAPSGFSNMIRFV